MRQFILFIGALSSFTTFANEGRHVFNLNPGDIKVAPVTAVSGSITPVVRSSAPPSSKGLAAATLGTALSPTTSAAPASAAPVAISAPVPSASTPPAAAPAKSGEAATAAQQAAGAAGEAAAAAKNAEENAAAAQQEANNANQRANNAEQANADLRRLLLDNNGPRLNREDFAKEFKRDQQLIDDIKKNDKIPQEQKKTLIAQIEAARDKVAEQNGLGRELAELKREQVRVEADKALKDAQAKKDEGETTPPAT